MEVLSNKLRLLVSTISLLRLRGRIITNPLVKKDNLDLIETIKEHFRYMNPEMLNFLYCYLYFHFDEFLNSTIELNETKDTIQIDSYDKEGPYDQFRRSTIELIDDEVAPIKISTQTVKAIEGEDYVVLSSDVTYTNTRALEMIKLQSGEKSKSVFFFQKGSSIYEQLEKLYEVAKLYPKETASYRSEEDIYTITNLFRTDKGYRAEKIKADKKHIDSLTPEIIASEEDNYFAKDATVPSLVREYLENLEIKKKAAKENALDQTTEEEIHYELSHLSEVDSDIAKFMMSKEVEKIDDDFFSDPKTK